MRCCLWVAKETKDLDNRTYRIFQCHGSSNNYKKIENTKKMKIIFKGTFLIKQLLNSKER